MLTVRSNMHTFVALRTYDQPSSSLSDFYYADDDWDVSSDVCEYVHSNNNLFESMRLYFMAKKKNKKGRPFL